MLLARLELAEGRPQAALDMLATLPQALPEQAQRDAAAVRGQALFRVGRPVDAVRALVEREVWLADAASILANQRMIWDGFRAIAGCAAGRGDRRYRRRRLARARAARDEHGRRPAPLVARVAPDVSPRIPPPAGLLAELLAAQRSTAFPSQIALLLPLSSPQRAFALAIRDGFMAAHLRNPSNTATSVRVYDSARLGSSRGVPASAARRRRLHRRAVGSAPRSTKSSGKRGSCRRSRSTYATNDTTFLSSFYQFALAPEDEARAIAAAAIAAGARNGRRVRAEQSTRLSDPGQLPRRVRGGRRRAARLVRLRAGAAGFLAADGGAVERHAQPRSATSGSRPISACRCSFPKRAAARTST